MPNTRRELRKLYNLKYKIIRKRFVKADFLFAQKIGFLFVFIFNFDKFKAKTSLTYDTVHPS